MQRLRAGVVLRLVVVFSLAVCQFGLGRFEFSLQGHLVHFGDQLSGLHHVVVVDVEAVDDARDLRSDLHLGNGFDGSGRRHRITDRNAACGCRFQGDPLPFRGPQQQPQHDDCNHDHGRNQDFLPFHLVLFSFVNRSYLCRAPGRCSATRYSAGPCTWPATPPDGPKPIRSEP